LTDVPVQVYSSDGGNAFVRLPIKVGDTGVVTFFGRANHSWLASDGGVVAPDAPRTRSLSDARFCPGLWPFTNESIGEVTDDLVIQNNLSSASFTPGGQMSFNGASDELIDLLSEVVTALIATTVTVPSTPATVPLNSVANLTALLIRINAIKKVGI